MDDEGFEAGGTSLDDHDTRHPKAKTKEPWLAVGLSHMFPGLGQLYAGGLVRGLLFLLASMALLYGAEQTFIAPEADTRWSFILLFALIILVIFNLFDAHRAARKENPEAFESARKASKDPWLAVFLSQLLPGLGHFYLRKWMSGIGALFLFGLIAMVVTFLGLDTESWSGRVLDHIIPTLYAWVVARAAYLSCVSSGKKSLRTVATFLALGFGIGLVSDQGIYFHRRLVAASYSITGRSMLPTLLPEDRIVVRRVDPGRVECGDIIAFRYPEDPAITHVKRVAAVGPAVLAIDPHDGAVTVDGRTLVHPAFRKGGFHLLKHGSLAAFSPDLNYYVPDKSVFVLADNAALSKDSRMYGGVPFENVVGVVAKIFYPFDRAGPVNVPSERVPRN